MLATAESAAVAADPRPRVAAILPPREGFGPHSAGAIALLQARLTEERPGLAASAFATTIIGAQAGSEPLFPRPYRAVRQGWWPIGGDRRYAAGVGQALRALRPALIEVHNRPDLARRLAGRFPARRIALFLHNDPRGMRGAARAAERAALSAGLGRVVCVSGFLADCWMEGLPATLPRPSVLPNCLDLAALPPPLPAERRQARILFTGRLVADKGADAFVAACAAALPELPGWQAAMIGADRFRPDSPETPFIAALRPRAEAAGISLLGYRDHATVMTELSGSAIAVVPSRWQEPFGLAALEAMAAGAALVASRRGGLAELTEGVAAVIEPEDPAGMAATILSLARDPPRRAELAAAGLRRVRDYDLPAARVRLDAMRMELLSA